MNTNPELDTAIQAVRTIIADTGYLPTLSDKRLDLFDLAWSHQDDDTARLENFAASRMADDPVTRSVIAGILWHVSEFDVPAWEDEAETWQSERRAVLDRYLARVAPSSVGNLPWLWWELHAAATIGNLKRVLELGRRAEDLSSDPADLVLVARIIFFLVRPGAAADMGPTDWIPHLSSDKTTAPLQLCYTFMQAVNIEGEQGLESQNLPAATADALHIARALIERAEQETGVLVPADQAIRAWCDFTLGRVNSDVKRLTQAAAAYAAAPAEPLLANTAGTKPETVTLNAAGLCYLLADKPELAEPLFRKCIAAAPEAPRFRMRFTECLIRQGRKSEALEAFAEYDRVQPDTSDSRWLSPLLLEIGVDWVSQLGLTNAMEAAAFTAPGRPVGEGVVRWLVPWFDKMSQGGRQKWWVGLYTLASPENAKYIGESIWSQAADSFGEAVAFELKAKIFRPFASTYNPRPLTDANKRVNQQQVGWQRSLEGRGMLGQMIECLLQSRYPTHEAARMLNNWLSEKHPRFLNHLRPQAMQLAELRAKAQHESHETVGELEVRQLYKDASAFLEALLESPTSSDR